MDLSILQNFETNTSDDWANWQFTNEEYKNFPLSFFNKFGKAIKLCNLSNVALNEKDSEFVTVEGNLKTKNKEYISKNITMGDKQKRQQGWTRIYTKKQKKNYKGYSNQYKTKFRELNVKNDWVQVKAISKRSLQQAPKVQKVNIQVLKSLGTLHYLNPKVERISWNKIGFKQNEAYKVKQVRTEDDSYLINIGGSLFDMEQAKDRINVVCSSEFLFALMTVRGGQYPWAISVSKAENVIMLDRYNSTEDHNFSYIDKFTPNENTTGNMPRDEAKVRQYCQTGTKITQIIKDLLASGDAVEDYEHVEGDEAFQPEEEQEEQTEEELDEVKKYVKLQIDNIDIYTSVKVNGMKKKSTGQEDECLIRAFVETGTDGAWIADIKQSQGTLVFQEYLSNSCSLQKWICEARLAGVEVMKFGFVAFDKQKPYIINVEESTVTNLEKYISFKHEDCYPVLKHIVETLINEEDGEYVLTKNAYTPLSLKLYKLPTKDEEEKDEDDN